MTTTTVQLLLTRKGNCKLLDLSVLDLALTAAKPAYFQ